ncbi:histidine phosphatase family protein [Streptacidiphilus sp. MAP12-16]|uniref:histidine phosphatase family protein n=1 Tax=Streptacidiphilus sp. MAP12-16 TaxID=3156300 RepID=UPI003514E012
MAVTVRVPPSGRVTVASAERAWLERAWLTPQVFTSGLNRAVETATIALHRHGNARPPGPRLRECNYTVWHPPRTRHASARRRRSRARGR